MVTVAALIASIFFAHLTLPLVLSALLVTGVGTGIHLYRLRNPSESLNTLFLVVMILGFGVVKALVSGVGIWESVFYYSLGLALVSATTLLVGHRLRRISI